MREGAWLENDDLLEVSIVDGGFASSVKDIVETRELFRALISAIKDADPIPNDNSVYDKVMMCISHPVHDMLRRNYTTIIKSLDSLVCSCTSSAEDDPFTRRGPPRTEQQDLLRQLGMLDAAMQLAESVFKDLNVPLSPVAKIPAIFQVVRRCYLLIERACIDNVPNKKTMLPYVSTIWSHLEVQVGAYFAMMVIFSDTRELLESVNEDSMRRIVQDIKNCKSALWARFLVQTCHEGDQPIRKNQNLLTQLILIEAPELIFKTAMTDNDVVLTSEGEHVSEFSVKSLIKDTPNEDVLFDTSNDDILPVRGAVCQKPRDLFQYHMSMMELLGWLVHGRNPWASEVLASNAARFGIEFKQLVRIMNRRELPFTYRTRACELIRRLYVDQDPHQTMTMLRSTRIWTKLFSETESLSRTSSQDNQEFSKRGRQIKNGNGSVSPTGEDSKEKPPQGARSPTAFTLGKKDNQRRGSWSPLAGLRPLRGDLMEGGEKKATFDGLTSLASMGKKQSLPNKFRAPAIKLETDVSIARSGSSGSASAGKNINEEDIATSVDEVFSQQPLHAFRDTNFANLKIALAELIQTGEHMNRVNSRRNAFLSSLVDLAKTLTNYGFYHKYETNIQDWGLRFFEVRNVVANLAAAVDPRTDLQGDGEGDGDVLFIKSDMFEMTPENMIIIEGKIKILDVIQTFLICCDNERMTEFQKFWERMLEKVLDREGGDSPNKRSISLPEDMERLSWQHNPPWSEPEVKAFAERIFGDEYNILPNGPRTNQVIELRRMGSRSSKGSMSLRRTASWGKQNSMLQNPAVTSVSTELEWSKIMLSLLLYPSQRLRELAFQGLISHFRPASSFMLSAFDLQIVYSPKLAGVYVDVCKEVAVLNRNVKYIVAGQECRDQGQAHATWMYVLKKWSVLCTVTLNISRQDVVEVQNILVNSGAVDVVTAILKLPMMRVRNQGFGNLDQPADREQCALFNAVYSFLSKVCDRHKVIQKKLTPLLDHFFSHIGIEGLNVEPALSALIKNNHELVSLNGRRWIKMFFEDIMNQYRCQRAEWLDGLHAMIRVGKNSVVEHQALTMVLFRRYENITAVFMRTPAEFERRINIMAGCREENEYFDDDVAELEYSLAVIRLLSVCCEGKNPAAEVYAARYISLQDAVKSIVKLNVRSNGEVEQGVDHVMAFNIKSDYLKFLHDVYSQTNVTRLVDELHRKDNGIWSMGSASRPKNVASRKASAGNISLMKCILNDLRLFVYNVQANLSVLGVGDDSASDTETDGDSFRSDPLSKAGGSVKFKSPSSTQRRLDEREMEALRLYIFTAVFQFLGFYFKARYAAVRGSSPDDEMISEKIYIQIRKFYNLNLTNAEACVIVDGDMVSGREKAGKVLMLMGQKTRRSSAGSGINYGQDSTMHLPSAFSISSVHSSEMSLAKIRVGYRVFAELVAGQYQITQFKELSRTGVKKLALMFSNDAEADLGMKTNPQSGGEAQAAVTIKNPSYNELLANILDLCSNESTGTQVLTDVLRLLRATIYFYEPHYDGKQPPAKELDKMWKLFLNDSPMEKMYGPKDEVMTWVQCKYDAMGATEAALMLSAHSSLEVRTSAIRLLLTLLQTGNDVVQQAVHDYFVTTKDTRFFKSAHDTMSACIVSLKDFKKSLKAMKKRDQKDNDGAVLLDGVNPMSLKKESEEFGRKSEVMLTLRLLQLMCEGQYKPMQDMMLKQPVDTASFDMLRKCVDLVELIQPLLNDSLSFGTGNLTVLFMQLVETISETVQGPHHQNQNIVLSSKFLAVVNRVFSTLTYSPVDSSMRVIEGMGGSVNDLKCWLKTSVLNCCHAILEGVGDEKRSSRALEFFELRNFEIQMVSIGQLLELVDIGTMSLSTSLSSAPAISQVSLSHS